MEFSVDFKLFTAVADLPENWDDLAVGNIFLTANYLRVLEVSAPRNMQCYFIGIFQKGELVGMAVSQFLDLSDVTSFGVRDNCFKTKIRHFVFRRFAAHVLIFGNNMLTGENTYRIKPSVDERAAFEAFDKALQQIKQILLANGRKTHLTIWKDFPIEKQSVQIPNVKTYFRFITQPNMVFEIRRNWQAESDYVAALNKKYRDQYKRARKKASDVIKRKLSLEEIVTMQDKIHELYLTVANNAPFNTFYLRKHHFEALKKQLGEQFLFYGYFIDGELIGFDTLVKNGRSTDTYFLGYDDHQQREKMLYLNMLYNMIGYSIKKQFERVIFARTALEIKSAVGATPVFLSGYIKHSNRFVNRFMSRLFPFFEPEMTWHQRHPFKD